jgi:hypothetical protein
MPSTLQPTPDPVEELIAFLEPFVTPIIERINVDEFTTVDFINAMHLDKPTKLAYEEALRAWHENNEDMSKMVVHGQVIPHILRRSGMVEWAGYAYGEEDRYGVPAWWRKIKVDKSRIWDDNIGTR